MLIFGRIVRRQTFNVTIVPRVKMNSDYVTNFRDVGEWTNLIVGKEHLKVCRLYRGGSIKDCFSAGEIQDPDLIICLKRSVDKPDWAKTLHAPTANMLDCYQCDHWEVRRWITEVIVGMVQARPKRTYIHCHSGRDRTGVIVAAILIVLGVPF